MEMRIFLKQLFRQYPKILIEDNASDYLLKNLDQYISENFNKEMLIQYKDEMMTVRPNKKNIHKMVRRFKRKYKYLINNL